MKFYLAARYSRYPEMQKYRARLTMFGHEVTSSWINGGHEVDENGKSLEAILSDRTRLAEEDVADLRAAEVIINFTEPPRSELLNSGRGGRHVEFGMAYAWKKLCIVIGYRENVFHALPGVRFHADWDEFEKRLYWLNLQED